MSWIKTLHETYENILNQGEKDLLPISHSTANAHIEVTLNTSCEMIHADFVAKEDAVTIIPVTESSASKGSGITPHPLCDKLQYLAGDYKDYDGVKGDKYYKVYMEQLKKWEESNYSNKKVKIIYNYLSKGKLISDLIKFNILKVDENNELLKKFESKDKTFSLGEQLDAFIRFRVAMPESEIDAVWQDTELFKDYSNYYLSIKKNKDFCYITGETMPCSNNHPSKILHSGDKAKIISSNDTTNFTFKGRFQNADQVVKISYDVSQKAHSALKWLIKRQAFRVGNKAFVLWGTENQKVPNIFADSVDFSLNDFLEIDINEIDQDVTKKELAKEFSKAILSYKAEIMSDTKLALIGLEPPTTGRMSIIFYREYNGFVGHELIDNVKKWHEETVWNHRYKFKDNKLYEFYGAPSLIDIINIAYGTDQNGIIKSKEEISANGVERLIPCVIDGRKIPRDIVLRLIDKSKHPQNYTNIYTWYKVLTISCAIYRKYLYDYEKEEYTMEVKNTDNLAYNCGRLLAIADAMESWSLSGVSRPGTEIRATNAIKYFTRFSISPATTWTIINNKLIPHKQRLGARGAKLYKLLGEISNLINPDDFEKASNLNGCMILGYDAQRQALFNESKNKENIEEE